MSSSTPASIDTYIAAQPDAARAVLEKMRRVIGKAIPEADEAISYGMPAYKLGGRVVVYFAGWKQHTALYPASAQTFAAFKKEVDGYATSKGTLQFPLAQPLPVKLIEAIARYRAAEVGKLNAGKAAAAKKAKKASAVRKKR
jgi:uncharacterized protein YdhG (YjbR/CyaY superfamily)